MIALTLHELAAAMSGRIVLPKGAERSSVLHAAAHAAATETHRDEAHALVFDGSVETDSRLVGRGSIFFALPGETTDGHRFIEQSVDAGAALVVVEREQEHLEVPQIVVADGVVALAALASAVVRRVRAEGRLSVIGITGSNGKTSTKNMLRAILSAEAPTVAPEGSFNNHVGAPISMLRIDHGTRYLIVEMGASGAGEIARLAAIAEPDVGVVLKVGLAHAGEFGGIEATQRAKQELVEALGEDGVAVLNADDGRVAQMADHTRARVVWFGHSATDGLTARDVETSAAGTGFTLRGVGSAADAGEHHVQLRIIGEHHVMNALAALTAVRELGVPLDRAIEALEGMPRAEQWRMELLPERNGVTVINDAYNASPDSTAAALKTLAQLTADGAGRSVAVLGEMAELGEFADEEHDRIGRLVVRLNIKQLVVVGQAARHIHNAAGLEGSWSGESILVDTIDEAERVLETMLRPGDVVLVKSSKSAGLRFLGDRIAGVER
ncbi:UDP-N-acetylmuramoyl-tripeptide--D-alanyl-D-alanine ligase [Ruicaihuangia caeni]|uniref:UDP-N-acetylmuramoyl-tripeptide--D-alanyl-D-alanine ligase n=1 Tax=Ruicaihuangia caeni TaxID=3042517 RepID=A0AAW6T6E4_9MICO|nr:UDP-N-acetylmuramoyl-tripeptide--D-alanyl-D-alanine ligase [Klugiella sp. YN-L-19]MDI2098246.1 UDP-N-acetylmuramoyl-tripeptide--D-alanyl-D-alanine ligase [Klugiella sp. YN-L-19]